MDKQNYTQQFLESMPRWFRNFCYYRLKDGKKGIGGAMQVTENMIPKYNSAEEKFGIYFTPNGDFALSDGVRQEATAKSINTFILDVDYVADFKIEIRQDFFIKPTAVVETKKGFHIYRVLKDSVSYDEHKKDFAAIQEWLCAKLIGDKKAKDIARILRLPGSKYWKDNKGDFTIECIELNEDALYDIQFFKECISAEAKIKKTKDSKTYGYDKNASETFEEIERNVSAADVLQDLGSKWTVKGARIYEGGKLTDGYKYNAKDNYIIDFSGNGRPQGGPFAVAKNILDSAPEAFMYFYKKYNIGHVQTVDIKKKGDAAKPAKAIDLEGDMEISAGNYILKFSKKDGKTYKVSGTSTKEILTACIIPVGYYVKDEKYYYIVDYTKSNGETGTIHMCELGRSGEMVKVLSSVGITYLGGKTETPYLISYIHSAPQQYKFIDKIGVYSKDLVINRPGNYILGEYYVSIRDLKPSGHMGEVISLGESGITKEDVLNEVLSLKDSYDSSITTSAFAYYGLSLFLKYIRETMSFMPTFTFVGLTQSGKTTYRELFMKMYGYDACLSNQASATEFSFIAMTKHYTPVFVTEYENEALRFDFDSFIKNNFDNTQTIRGTASQSINIYEQNASLVIDGETRSLTNSVYTRGFMAFMNPRRKKTKIPSKPRNINRYFIDNYDNIYKLPAMFEKKRVELHKELAHIEKSEKDRLIQIYAMLLAFLECFDLHKELSIDVKQLMIEQFAAAPEDNLINLIKQFMINAKNYAMIIEFDKDGRLHIQHTLDAIRFDKSKVNDYRSSVQTVNQYFGWENPVDDVVMVPFDFIVKTRALHMVFNHMVSFAMTRQVDIKYSGARDAIIKYCEKYNYKSQPFYDDAIVR